MENHGEKLIEGDQRVAEEVDDGIRAFNSFVYIQICGEEECYIKWWITMTFGVKSLILYST